jgi:hypothetical protein
MRFVFLLDLGLEITPSAAVGDKGYAGKGNRASARERGIAPLHDDKHKLCFQRCPRTQPHHREIHPHDLARAP